MTRADDNSPSKAYLAAQLSLQVGTWHWQAMAATEHQINLNLNNNNNNYNYNYNNYTVIVYSNVNKHL